jgi:hypothetical protein
VKVAIAAYGRADPINYQCQHERNGANGSGETASGGTIMEAGIARARCVVTGHPLAGSCAGGGKLAASPLC